MLRRRATCSARSACSTAVRAAPTPPPSRPSGVHPRAQCVSHLVSSRGAVPERRVVSLPAPARDHRPARIDRAVSAACAACALLSVRARGRQALPGKRVALDLGFSQSELAQLLGASRPKVNTALGELEGAGAIVRTLDRFFCDPAKLTEIARARCVARISHTGCALRRFKKPTGQKPRAARCGASGKRGDTPCRLLQPALRVAFRRASPAPGVSTVWPDTVFAARRRSAAPKEQRRHIVCEKCG